jgi:putative transposase
MKKSKFTEAQIVFALKQSDNGVAVSDICRKMGISEAMLQVSRPPINWTVLYR